MAEALVTRVEVEWLDSHVHDRWVTPASLLAVSPALCTSVGYLVHEDDRVLTIAQSRGLTTDGTVEEYGQPITIPRAALLSKRTLTTHEHKET